MRRKMVWSIAGSDCAGYSGIQNDLKTYHHLGVHGCSIITAVTAQNSKTIKDVLYLDPHTISSQIETLDVHAPDAIKIGMVGNLQNLTILKLFLQRFSKKVVFDPLIYSTSGNKLFQADLREYLPSMIEVFPLVDVITPNLDEAHYLSNVVIDSYQDMECAASKLLSLGAKSVLIKGGHFENDVFSHDYWTNGIESFWLASKRIPKINCRGTGCALSSAITACLALGYNIKDAIVIAKMYLNQGMQLAERHPDPFLFVHANWPEQESYLPYLSEHPILHEPNKFNLCDFSAHGVYPIVDSLKWIKTLISSGVKIIQLRIKNKTGTQLEDEIKQSIQLCKEYQIKLFVNDYWSLAIQYDAYGVHLGQEDLKVANIDAIYRAGLQLGISTHCYAEVARAHAFRPSYLACGPIFPTTSKIMSFAPQGIEQLKRWRKTLTYPLVAIGGINRSNMQDIIDTKVEGIAMISAITHARDPQETTQQFLRWMANGNHSL